MQSSIQTVLRDVWKTSGFDNRGRRVIPEEVPVAFSYNGSCHAVMMATPQDLRDLAIGFSLNEGIVHRSSEFVSLEIIVLDNGIDLQMWLETPNAERLSQRRRHLAGPTGCGLCGIESMAEAVRPCVAVGTGRSFSGEQIIAAVRDVTPLQTINIETRAVHAAAFWMEDGIAILREDVGRHNALDKLAGAIEQRGIVAGEGMVLLTSRVSVEMVQKTAAIGAALLVSVSAPTAAAVRIAQAAGITLVAIARDDGFEVFTHPHRVRHLQPAGDFAADRFPTNVLPDQQQLGIML